MDINTLYILGRYNYSTLKNYIEMEKYYTLITGNFFSPEIEELIILEMVINELIDYYILQKENQKIYDLCIYILDNTKSINLMYLMIDKLIELGIKKEDLLIKYNDDFIIKHLERKNI